MNRNGRNNKNYPVLVAVVAFCYLFSRWEIIF